MFRKTLLITTLASLMSMSTMPTMAENFNRHALQQFNAYGHYDRPSETAVGVYLRMPFTGNLKRSVSNTRFGLTLGKRQFGNNNFTHGFTAAGTRQFIDLSVGLSGRDSIRFNGMSSAKLKALYADETRKETKLWPIALGGGLIISLVDTYLSIQDECWLFPCFEGEIRN